MSDLMINALLHGADVINASISGTPLTPSLSSADGAASHIGMRASSIPLSSSYDTATTERRITTGTIADRITDLTQLQTAIGHCKQMGRAAAIAAGANPSAPYTPEYNFSGSMPEVVMHNYLDRALNYMGLALEPGLNDGPLYDDTKWLPATWSTSWDYSALTDTRYGHGQALQLILNLGAKFVGDIFPFSDVDDGYLFKMACTGAFDIAYIQTFDPDVIFQGGYGEWVNSTCNHNTIPVDILAKFGQTDHRDHLGNPSSNFDYLKMLYPGSSDPTTPDITQIETQMWCYYLCTTWIDTGCESIHCGDFFNQNKNDHAAGNAATWKVFSMIREYAAANARRGVILLDSHIFTGRPDAVDNVYYDPPDPAHSGRLLVYDNWQRQLLFDFHSLGQLYDVPAGYRCWGITGANPYGNGCFPLALNYRNNNMLYTNNWGGLNPQGWLCTHNPVLLEFDTGGVFPITGCVAADNGYGWDNFSWFAANASWVRNEIIRYCYYRIKCLDPNAHFFMPGRRNISPRVGLPPDTFPYYDLCVEDAGGLVSDHTVYAPFGTYPGVQTGIGGADQVDTIQKVWSGYYAGPYDWAHHNFTIENVANPVLTFPTITSRWLSLLGFSDVQSDLIFTYGQTRMYYITTHGHIGGYFYNNGEYNGGNWLSIDIPCPVAPKGSLVASPDGSRLLYIGIDGRLHGFDIYGPWTFEPISFPFDAGVEAETGLVYPEIDRIYYIGKMIDGSRRIHGMQRSTGTWELVSPSYGAEIIHRQSVSGQESASNALLYDAVTSRLYYTGMDGLLYYFEVRSYIDFYYVPCPGNTDLVANELNITGNLALFENKLYFTAHQHRFASILGTRVYCLEDDGSRGWDFIAISAAAAYHGVPLSAQVQAAGTCIAVSQDGKSIAYIAADASSAIAFYTTPDGINYYYHDPANASASNSLQFKNNTELYFVSSITPTSILTRVPSPSIFDNRVHLLRYEEAYCINGSVTEWPFP